MSSPQTVGFRSRLIAVEAPSRIQASVSPARFQPVTRRWHWPGWSQDSLDWAAASRISRISVLRSMTIGIKKAWEATTGQQRQQVGELMVKWNVKRSDAIRLARGEDLAVILTKYDRRQDGRVNYRTIGSRRGYRDVMSRRLPGSFGSAIK